MGRIFYLRSLIEPQNSVVNEPPNSVVSELKNSSAPVSAGLKIEKQRLRFADESYCSASF